MSSAAQFRDRLRPLVNRRRLVETATALIGVASPTGEGRAVADALGELLKAEGFTVERPAGGYPHAPAVAVRWSSGQPGRTLQLNGHLDTVHLPFVPPQVTDGQITGSGASDMKSGIAAAVEALRVVREAGALERGSVLLTAHDLHEAPWGFGQQLDGLIDDGYVGDAVLLPEPLCGHLPVIGRGQACWKITISRSGVPVHEVMRPLDEPSVIAAGAELVARLGRLDQRLSAQSDPLAGRATVFIGQIHSGEIFNQYPQVCWLEGTRRWLPGTAHAEVEREFRAVLDSLASETGTQVEARFQLVRDAFFLDQTSPLVAAFQEAYEAQAGRPLGIGPKPFVDDGNCFWGRARVPAITHGPRAGGQHTVNEWVEIEDLVRVAELYAVTAALFCAGE